MSARQVIARVLRRLCDVADTSVLAPPFSYACSLLGQDGGAATCDAIAANGTTGTYGALSFCAADIKLSCEYRVWYRYGPMACTDRLGRIRLSLTDAYSAHYVFTNYNREACK